jgi:hypothetical protein
MTFNAISGTFNGAAKGPAKIRHATFFGLMADTPLAKTGHIGRSWNNV